jgi:hypothetical protein
MENWESKPPGTLWATPGLLGDSFIFTYCHYGYPCHRGHISYQNSYVYCGYSLNHMCFGYQAHQHSLIVITARQNIWLWKYMQCHFVSVH